MKNKLFTIVGKSSVGKDVISKILLEKIAQENLPIKKLQSCTTRPKRGNEVDGVDYKFMTLHDFDLSSINNEIVEYNVYRIDNLKQTWVYYTLKSDIDLKSGSMVKIVNPIGLAQLKQQFNNDIVVFYITCPTEIRKQRYIERGALTDSLEHRFNRDERDFRYFKYDYEIVNDGTYSLESRADLILKLMKGEMGIE